MTREARVTGGFLSADRPLKPDVDAIIELVQSGAIMDAVESAVGRLD